MNTPYIGGLQRRVSQAVGATFAAAAALLAACGGGSSSHSGATPAARSMHGTVYGGRQPVSGSTVTVYSAGVPGAQFSTQIGQTTTDANGQWNVATLSPAPAAGQLVYVVATGGNAGGGSNSDIALMTLAGLSPNFPSALNVDELSTVAATAVLQNQITLPECSTVAGNTVASGRCVAIAGANNSLGQRAGTFTNLVDPATGAAATFLTAAASGSPLNLTLQKLDSLADLLANCVNSAGGSLGDGGACSNLFIFTSSSSDTLAAALNMATSPVVNADGQGLLGLLKPPLVYSPTVSAAPANWTVGGQQFAYVLDVSSSATLSGFSIDAANGVLTRIGGSPVSGVTVGAPAASPSGRFVYAVTDASTGGVNGVKAFSVDPASGTLTPVSGSPFATAGGGYPSQVVVDPSSRFAYAAADGVGVSAYRIDADSGALTLVGGPYPTGSRSTRLTVSPNGKFVYVLNFLDDDISGFSINPSSGALTSLGPAIPTGFGPDGFAFTPDSSYFYVSNFGTHGNASNGSISAYAFNASTGALTPVTAGGAASCGSANDPFNCFSLKQPFNSAYQVAVDGSGLYLYTATGTGDAVIGFRIDPATGALTLLSPSIFTAGMVTQAVGTDASGRFLYALNFNSNNISAYTIDAASGALNSVGVHSPFAAGNQPRSIAIDPTGKFVYAPNYSGADVSAYTVDSATGGLIPVSGGGAGACTVATDPLNCFATGGGPNAMSVGQYGFGYVLNASDGTLSGYGLDPVSGALAPVPGSPFAGVSTSQVTTIANLVFAGSGANVADYTLDPASGSLTQVTGSPFATTGGMVPNDVAVFPGLGATIYAVGPGGVDSYFLNASNGLTANGGPYSTGNGSSIIAVSPNLRFAYVANFLDNTLSAFSIDLSSGALTSLGTPIPTGLGPDGIAFAPGATGTFYLYVSNFGNPLGSGGPGSVSAFAVNASTGAAASVIAGAATNCGVTPDPHNCFFLPAPAGGSTPIAHQIAIASNGQYAYVADSANNAVAGFSIDPATGALAPISSGSPYAAASAGPDFLTVGP